MTEPDESGVRTHYFFSSVTRNTDAAVRLVSRLCGLPAMNLMDRRNHDALLDLLQDKLGA